MSIYEIEIPEAFARMLAAKRLWWAENRQMSPFSVDDDFVSFVDIVVRSPRLGVRDPNYKEEVRSMLLRKSKHRIAYEVLEDKMQIHLLAIWHTRERRPTLVRS